MYSPCSNSPQALHLKHQTWKCLSKAIKACPSFNSSPQPGRKENLAKFCNFPGKNICLTAHCLNSPDQKTREITRTSSVLGWFVISPFGRRCCTGFQHRGRLGTSGFQICQSIRILEHGTGLAQTIFSGKCHPFPGWKRLFATGTFETGLVIGFAQCSDNFALYKGVAFGTFGTKIGLVAIGAKIVFFFGEITSLRQ